jgi:NAD(P)-dependent dehydrogenase (short-subunit alcohol dehydrogenase family)
MTVPPLPLAGRSALVTGATRGIGRAAALALGAAGAQVIAVGRTQGALEDLDDAIRQAGGPRPTLVPMDLTNGPGIDQLGWEIFQRHKKLDILVHAAAILGGLRPVGHIPPDTWDKVVATNLTCGYRLIRSMEPLLKASDAGRAIFLTSERAVRPKAFWGSYAATKAGLEALVRCWADEVDGSPLRAIIVDPGQMRTRMREQAYPGEDPATLPDPNKIGPMIVQLASSADPGPPDEAVRFADWMDARAQTLCPTPPSASVDGGPERP